MEEALTRIWPIDKDVKVRDFIPLQNKPMDPWLYAVQQAKKLAGALQLQHEQSRGYATTGRGKALPYRVWNVGEVRSTGLADQTLSLIPP
jgi:hypothetical protein